MLIANNEARIKEVHHMMSKYDVKNGEIGEKTFENILNRKRPSTKGKSSIPDKLKQVEIPGHWHKP